MPLVEVGDLERAEGWFDRHGGLAVLIGRVVPVVRSLVSVPAGVERMPLWRFVLYTIISSGVYNLVLVGLGFVLGSHWKTVERYSNYLNYAIYAAIAIAVGLFVVKRLRRRGAHSRLGPHDLVHGNRLGIGRVGALPRRGSVRHLTSAGRLSTFGRITGRQGQHPGAYPMLRSRAPSRSLPPDQRHGVL